VEGTCKATNGQHKREWGSTKSKTLTTFKDAVATPVSLVSGSP
jgi:hypothetical protein